MKYLKSLKDIPLDTKIEILSDVGDPWNPYAVSCHPAPPRPADDKPCPGAKTYALAEIIDDEGNGTGRYIRVPARVLAKIDVILKG
jgi:hypothetical protein